MRLLTTTIIIIVITFSTMSLVFWHRPLSQNFREVSVHLCAFDYDRSCSLIASPAPAVSQ